MIRKFDSSIALKTEAYKDIRIDLELRKILGLLTDEEMIKIKDRVKEKINKSEVSKELDTYIPKFIKEVLEEMKTKKDEFLSKESLESYISNLRQSKKDENTYEEQTDIKDPHKVLKMPDKDSNMAA